MKCEREVERVKKEIMTSSVFLFLEQKYLVNTVKCKIPDLDPWNSDIKRFIKNKNPILCSKKRLLTYVSKRNNKWLLMLDKSAIPLYSKNGITCCYSNVSRGASSDPDKDIRY